MLDVYLDSTLLAAIFGVLFVWAGLSIESWRGFERKIGAIIIATFGCFLLGYVIAFYLGGKWGVVTFLLFEGISYYAIFKIEFYKRC